MMKVSSNIEADFLCWSSFFKKDKQTPNKMNVAFIIRSIQCDRDGGTYIWNRRNITRGFISMNKNVSEIAYFYFIWG